MLLFYTLLFFLSGISVIAAPVPGGVPRDGTYWFPKKPLVSVTLTFK